MWLSFKSKLDKLTTELFEQIMFVIVPAQLNVGKWKENGRGRITLCVIPFVCMLS